MKEVKSTDRSENRLPVDPALAESGSLFHAQLGPRLLPGERLLWAAHTTVLDMEKFPTPYTYALTDRRVIAISKDGRERVAAWDRVTRVSMTRYSNGRGRLELVLSPDVDKHNRIIDLKNCPDFSKVQRFVEQIYFGQDSDPDSLPEIEGEVAQPEKAVKEGGTPLRWRYRLEAELLPEEHLRWIGRANRREIKRVLGGCLLWGLAFLVGVMLIGFWPFGLAMLGLMLMTILFTSLVLLNTVYAITDRRVMQVRGLQSFSTRRTIEFYPRLKFEEVHVAQDLASYTGKSNSKNKDFIDLVIQEESYGVSSRYNSSGTSRRPIQFIGLHRKEIQEIKGFIKQVSQRGPLIPGKNNYNQKAKNAPRFDQGFGNLNPFSEVTEVPEVTPAPKRSRKRPK